MKLTKLGSPLYSPSLQALFGKLKTLLGFKDIQQYETTYEKKEMLDNDEYVASSVSKTTSENIREFQDTEAASVKSLND